MTGPPALPDRDEIPAEELEAYDRAFGRSRHMSRAGRPGPDEYFSVL